MKRFRLFKKYNFIDLGIYLYEEKKNNLMVFWNYDWDQWVLSCFEWNDIKNEVGDNWEESEIVEYFCKAKYVWDYIEENFKEINGGK